MTGRPSGSPVSMLKDYVQLAAEIELAVAELYDMFASTFSKNEELSHFWRLSAEAERYHAATIHVHLLVLEESQADSAPQLPVEMDEMKRFQQQIAEIKARCLTRAPSPAEALLLAQKVEEQGSETHGRAQFDFLYPSLKDLFVRMAEEDLAHRRSFASAMGKFAQTQPSATE
jgi:hypothetical protein